MLKINKNSNVFKWVLFNGMSSNQKLCNIYTTTTCIFTSKTNCTEYYCIKSKCKLTVVLDLQG